AVTIGESLHRFRTPNGRIRRTHFGRLRPRRRAWPHWYRGAEYDRGRAGLDGTAIGHGQFCGVHEFGGRCLSEGGGQSKVAERCGRGAGDNGYYTGSLTHSVVLLTSG